MSVAFNGANIVPVLQKNKSYILLNPAMLCSVHTVSKKFLDCSVLLLSGIFHLYQRLYAV